MTSGSPQPAIDRPNRVPWPPLIYVAALAVGLMLELAGPTAHLLEAVTGYLTQAVGWLMLVVGAMLDGWAMLTMARARTNILPHRAADHLVTTGPFQFTRNPIYVGNTTMLAGAGLGFGKLWLVAMALIAAMVTHRLAVLREEAHLQAKFGDAWRDYAAATPRWLGLPR